MIFSFKLVILYNNTDACFYDCRLDSLVGLFAAGCQPSSTNDPFGLRRISYGLVSLKIF